MSEKNTKSPAEYRDEIANLLGQIRELEQKLLNMEQSNTMLQRKNEYYLRVISSVNDGYVVHRNGIITAINKRVSEITGYSSDELVGSDLLEHVAVESRNQILSHISTKTSMTYEIDIIRKNGDTATLELTAGSIEGDEGRVVIVRDITDKKKIEQDLKDSELVYRTLTEQAIIGIYTIDDGVVTYANDLMQKVSGYRKEDILTWGPEDFLNLVHPEDREFAREQYKKKITGETEATVTQYDLRIITSNGTTKWVTLFSKPIRINKRYVIMSAMLDIDERKNAETNLRESEERFRILADSPFQGMFIHDESGIILANRTVFKMLGLDQHNPRDFEKVYGVHALRFVAKDYHWKVFEDIRQNHNQPYEVKALRLNGSSFFAELQSSWTFLNGSKMRVFAIRDITERKRVEFVETHDRLTGFLNETGFLTKLAESIKQEEQFEVMEIELSSDDLNKIRHINVDENYKSIGNDLEEFIISDIASTLSRQCFPDKIIARDGNRFFLLCPHTGDTGYTTGHSINTALSIFPYSLKGFPNEVDAHISITAFPQDFDSKNPKKILNNCDSAIQWARDKNVRFMLFNKKRDSEVRELYRLEQDLKVAVHNLRNNINNNEFYIAYQPKVNAKEKIVGLEALIRWNHPEIGEITPTLFIGIAEHNGLIGEIGRWVVQESCSHLSELLKINPLINISINVSPQQLEDDFSTYLEKVLDTEMIQHKSLEIEIIEREIVKKENIRILEHFFKMGIKIAVDDFTDEQAGLKQIARLSGIIETIKFSLSSINYIMENESYAFIVKGLIDLVHNFKQPIQVVAEGVDSREKFDRCLALGFDQIQGFYNGREPKLFHEISTLLRNETFLH
ncbi:MAG TPA: EAL domain-containing protein [Spirochaetota bacterium]|nr:EAL domain-containing protein [Spirochaetota bacterium]